MKLENTLGTLECICEELVHPSSQSPNVHKHILFIKNIFMDADSSDPVEISQLHARIQKVLSEGVQL